MSSVAILVGSVYGGAEELAENAEKMLQQAGHQTQQFSDAALAHLLEYNPDIWLVITSTTGQGDVPANLESLYFEIKDSTLDLGGKQYAVIAMGDSSYGDTFCQAGRHFDEVLAKSMASRVQPLLEIDACETMDSVGAAQEWLESLLTKLA